MSAASLSSASVHGKRALITGLHGFTGRHLAGELTLAGYQVFGTVHNSEDGSENTFAVDLRDRARLAEVVAQVRPQVVAHLAAISFVAHGDAEAMYGVNIVGTRNLLDALAQCGGASAILLASSANIYGNATVESIDEKIAAAPANDYAVSKLAMEQMARLWCERLPIVFTRPFNYTGVGQAENFLLPKIVSHYRRAARTIELGNLDVARDFSDVRMVVSTYRRLLDLTSSGQIRSGQTFNICSGTAYTLMEVLAMLSAIAGYEIDVKVNPAFVRANEVKRLVGSNARLRQTIGDFNPIPLQQTLRWMMQA